jgi:hypothetical protein
MTAAPIIAYPETNWQAGGPDTYRTSEPVIMISGTVPVVPAEIDDETIYTVQQRYQIERGGVLGSFTDWSDDGIAVGDTSTSATEIPWSFDGEFIIDPLEGDTINLQLKTVVRRLVLYGLGPVIDESTASEVTVVIVDEDDITATAERPTAIQMRKSNEYIKLLIPQTAIRLSDDSDFAGCNFYVSLTAGTDYVRMNDVLVTDPDESETVETNVSQSDYDETAGNLHVQTTMSTVSESKYYTFSFTTNVLTKLITEGKVPNIFLADGKTLNSGQRFYFVASFVVFDSVLNEATESPYSMELMGNFLEYTTNYRALPARSRNDILFSMSRDLMGNNTTVNVVAGSVIRDMMDPLSLEFERFYVIQDFIFASMSLDTLLKFDDADGDGLSDPVSTSINKRKLAAALGVRDQVSLQILIDEQFDKWAANFDLSRHDSRKAVGTAVVYVTTPPQSDIIVPNGTSVSYPGDLTRGIAAIPFLVKSNYIMDSGNLDYYYNPALQRWEMSVAVEARVAGSSGNVPARSITRVDNANTLLQVTNTDPTLYGSDRETNQELASRVKLARASFDSGTEPGYASVAYSVPGVLQARVEKEGDPLMMRDYDDESQRHIGGKVDIYIKGSNLIQVTDQVAFKYEYPTDTFGNKVGEQFDVSDALSFRLRSRNVKVGESSPIVIVNRVRNVTRGSDYDLTALQITSDGNTVILVATLTNRTIGLATMDVVEVDYRYRSSNTLVLGTQPVMSIDEVTDSNGTIIDTSKYQLVKLEDPLTTGNSSISKDAIQFLFDDGDNIEEFVTITDEPHDMLLDTNARLLYKGVDESTIVVQSQDATPETYLKDVDYEIVHGDEVEYTYLKLLSNGKIRHGDQVNVTYNAAVNFNVTYTINSLVDQVAAKLPEMEHACADVIVKQAVENLVDFAFKVVRKTGVDKTLLKSRIQRTLANFVRKIKMGDTLSQDDVINVVRGVDGVKSVQMPLTRIMKRNGSFIALDDVGSPGFEIYQRTGAGGVTSYRTVSKVLEYSTTDNGGPSNLFRGIYEDSRPLTLVSDSSQVGRGPGNGYIQADGKIIVSTTDGRPPQEKKYKVSYYAYYTADENVVSDILTSQLEYLAVDNVSSKNIEIVDDRIVKRGL